MTEQAENNQASKNDDQGAREAKRELRVRGQRSLIIHVLLMFLVSIVVFVIGSYFFLVPQIIRHRLDAQHTANKVTKLQQQVAQMGQDLARLNAPAPASDAVVQPDSK